MNSSHDWSALNQQTLTLAIDRVQQRLQAFVDRMNNTDADADESKPIDSDVDTHHEFQNSALQTLCIAFRLSSFERDVLLLCAGVELSGTIAQLCTIAQGNPSNPNQTPIGPTFSLALALFPDAHWSALVPAYPLRRWRLIDVGPGDSLTQCRLRLEERVLHYLNGVSYLDDRLCGVVFPILPTHPPLLPQSHLALVDRILDRWSTDHGHLIQLYGTAPDSQQAIATTVCYRIGIQLHRLAACDIPSPPADRETLARLWEREATLNPSVLLIDLTDIELDRSPFLLPWITTLQSRVILLTRDPITLRQRPTLRLEVPKPTAQEQQTLWRLGLLGEDDRADNAASNHSPNLTDHLEQLVSQFELDATAIQDNCREFKLHHPKFDFNPTSDPILESLWETCRSHSRLRLDELAQRIPARAHWQDLVLPDRQRELLAEIMAQVRSRSIVYNRWGFADRSSHGFGISALFSGPSGTGKTLAAEVIAHELRLDLYRIDLSQVVSKYIGETEKNLRRIFDAAETGGAILLFDEADALFGKRSEVKDSHDRHANVEVSYLLQRMEAYRGLAILTTNLQGSIDPAFLRRIRFLIPFPFPDQEQRIEIWKRMFSPKVPIDGVDFEQLAQLNVAGGNIRTIALNAAFLAADARSPLQMTHLLRSATSEYLKLDKTLTNAEVNGWIA